MFLSYAKYIELLSALDEYSNCKLEKADLQNAIFKHYTDKYGSITVENSKGSKLVFTVKYQKQKYNKNLRKQFRNFINQ